MTTKNIGQSHRHIRLTKLANVVLRMVIITARSLHTALVVTLALSRSGSHCIRLVLTSLPPASAQGQLLTIKTWQLIMNLSWDSTVNLYMETRHVLVRPDSDTICAPAHSPLSGCTLQVTAGPAWAGCHSVDSFLTRECLPLTIFRTGAGVNQSGPEYSGPSNQSSESWADSQLEIVSACQCDEHFRFERNFPYS